MNITDMNANDMHKAVLDKCSSLFNTRLLYIWDAEGQPITNIYEYLTTTNEIYVSNQLNLNPNKDHMQLSIP